MALIKRGVKNAPISAIEYDAVVTQVEINLDSISVLNGAFNDSEVTLSFVDLAAATSYWNAASVKPINNVVLYLQDVKTFYKWDSTNANKAITTGRFYVEGEATPTAGSTKFVFSKDVKVVKDTLQNNIDAEATDRENADLLKANIANPTFTGTVGGITKAMVGLGNADNTSDANKPVSTLQANALALKLDKGTFAANAENLNNSIKNQLSNGVYVINSNNTVTGKYLNTSGTLTTLAGYDVNKYPIVAGKTILIKGIVNVTTAMAAYAFGTESGTATIDQSTRVDQAIGENTYNIEVIVPEGMTYLFVNKDIANTVYVGESLKSVITDKETLTNKNIKQQLSESVYIIEPTFIDSGKYLNTARSVLTSNLFNYNKIPVIAGNTIIISGIIEAIAMMSYAFGTGSTTGTIDLSTQVNHTQGQQVFRYEVVVPTGMTYLFVNTDKINHVYAGVKVSTVNPSVIFNPFYKDATRFLNISAVIAVSSDYLYNKFELLEGKTYKIKGTINASQNMLLYAFGTGSTTGSISSNQIVTISSGVNVIDVSFTVPLGFRYIFTNNDNNFDNLTITQDIKTVITELNDEIDAVDSRVLANKILATKGIVNHNNTLFQQDAMTNYINTLKCTDEWTDFLVQFNTGAFAEPFTHTSCFDIDQNNNVYLVYMINTVNNDEIPNIIKLHKFNLATPTTIERFTVFEWNTTNPVTYNGFTITEKLLDPNIKVIGDKVFINISTQFNSNNTWVMACRPFNISSSTFSNLYILNYVFGSDTYQFNNANVNATLVPLGAIALNDYQAIQPNFSKRVESGVDYYYVGMGSVSRFQGMILKTSDFINYKFVAFPIIEGLDAQYEPAVFVYGDFVYMIMRQATTNTAVFTRYSIVNNEFDQVIYLEDTISRSSFMLDGTTLYALIAPYNRSQVSFLEVNKTNLNKSKYVQSVNGLSAFYPFAMKFNSKFYAVYTSSIGATIKNQISFSEFSIKSISKTTINNYFKTAFSI
jgi:hypothetical protein